MPQEEFWDTFADFYDAYYDDDIVPDDMDFYVELARNADGPVLEVGCGTGRIYLELLRAGIDAHGIDISQGMLEVLRERAAEQELTPQVWEADMRSFDTETEYDLIIVPFRSFLHSISVIDQKATLRNFRNALGPARRNTRAQLLHAQLRIYLRGVRRAGCPDRRTRG